MIFRSPVSGSTSFLLQSMKVTTFTPCSPRRTTRPSAFHASNVNTFVAGFDLGFRNSHRWSQRPAASAAAWRSEDSLRSLRLRANRLSELRESPELGVKEHSGQNKEGDKHRRLPS